MPENNQFQDPNIVKLLWTSGWDSTFRLLQLVVEKQATVLPFYIISDRPSMATEIETMNKIKKQTYKLFPETVGRILPTVFYAQYDIAQYPDVTEKIKIMKSKAHFGSQYGWLFRFAKQHGINDLELSIHADDRAYGFFKHLKTLVVKNENQYGAYYSLDPTISNDDPLSIFKPFRFPLLEWSKVSMKEHALKIGTFDIMNLTWFCHRPINGKPCGLCSPCNCTIEEGMDFRFPKTSLLRHQLGPTYTKAIKVFQGAKNLLRPVKS